jgi:thiamine kinase-like enzyme
MNTQIQPTQQEQKEAIADFIKTKFPSVSHIPSPNFTLKHLDEGMTNKVYLITASPNNNESTPPQPQNTQKTQKSPQTGQTAQTAPFRCIYKEKPQETTMDWMRHYQARVRAYMHQNRIRPLCHFENQSVIIEECVAGRNLTLEECMEPEVQDNVMTTLADWVNSMAAIEPLNEKNILCDAIDRGLLDFIQKHLKGLKSSKLTSELKQKNPFKFESLQSELTLAYQMLEQLNSPQLSNFLKRLNRENNIFLISHNDLFKNNVLLDPTTNKMSLIDFEYTCFNPLGYDIGYFNVEIMIVGNEDFSEFKLDLGLLFSDETLKRMISKFLERVDIGLLGVEEGDERLELGKLVKDTKEIYTLINCFVYVWCILKVGEETGFNLASYMKCKLELGEYLGKTFVDGWGQSTDC